MSLNIKKIRAFTGSGTGIDFDDARGFPFARFFRVIELCTCRIFVKLKDKGGPEAVL